MVSRRQDTGPSARSRLAVIKPPLPSPPHPTRPHPSYVLVVPGVAVSDGGAVADASDLVTVIPPCHDPGVGRGVVTEPPIRFAVVIDGDRSAWAGGWGGGGVFRGGVFRGGVVGGGVVMSWW